MSNFWPVPGGGVTVAWSWTDPGDGHGAGAIRQYHLPQARAAVLASLQQARANGQQRIAVCTEYFEGGTSFHLDSADGLCAQDKANLQAFCADAKGLGFGFLLLETGPAWSADPNDWQNPTVMQSMDFTPRPFEPEAYGRNFKIVMDQCDVVMAAGFSEWGLDSHTEAFTGSIPMSADLLYYLQRWWHDVRAQIPPDNNFGLSCVDIGSTNIPQLVANWKAVYQDALPRLWLVHAYNNLAAVWPALKAEIDRQGVGGRGYLVGESFCDDPATHSIIDSDPNVFWRHSWPIGTNTPQGVVQDRFATGYVGQ